MCAAKEICISFLNNCKPGAPLNKWLHDGFVKDNGSYLEFQQDGYLFRFHIPINPNSIIFYAQQLNLVAAICNQIPEILSNTHCIPLEVNPIHAIFETHDNHIVTVHKKIEASSLDNSPDLNDYNLPSYENIIAAIKETSVKISQLFCLTGVEIPLSAIYVTQTGLIIDKISRYPNLLSRGEDWGIMTSWQSLIPSSSVSNVVTLK